MLNFILIKIKKIIFNLNYIILYLLLYYNTNI